jgi:general secretion pathway protein M
MQWFSGLSRRERILVSFAAVLSGLIFLIYIVIFPLQNIEKIVKNEMEEALRFQSEISSAAAILKSAPETAPPLPLPLPEMISNSAAESGFAAQVIVSPNKKVVEIAIESAKSLALFSWIAQLERQGIVVQFAEIQPQNDGIIAAKLSFAVTGDQ